MDVGRVKFLGGNQLGFLAANADIALANVPKSISKLIQGPSVALALQKKTKKSLRKQKRLEGGRRESGFLAYCEAVKLSDGSVGWSEGGQTGRRYERAVKGWFGLSAEERRRFSKHRERRARDPVTHVLQRTTHLGALSEKMMEAVGEESLAKHVPGISEADKEKLLRLFYWKGLRGLADPGECVGLLASQSIGEPSTQMTLNTFHFAGRGEMNVTLGIPRLREILMVASKSIKTPTSQVPFRPGVSEADEARLKNRLDRVWLRDVLKATSVCEASNISVEEESWYDTVRIELKPRSQRGADGPTISCDDVLAAVEKGFFRRLGAALLKRQEESVAHRDLAHKAMQSYMDEVNQSKAAAGADSDGGDGSGDEGGADDGAAGERLKRRMDDAGEYEGEEEEAETIQPLVDDDEDDDDEDEEDEKAAEEDEEGKEESAAARPGKVREMDKKRLDAVVRSSKLIFSYSYDPKHSRWAECVFKIPVHRGRLDLKAIFEREVASFVVKTIPGIEKCFLPKGEHLIRTAGLNLQELFRHGEILELDAVRTNDIHMMAATYGIEAAARVLVMEVKGVFGGYGIEVDNRHLSLVSDYLTFSGAYRAFNRSYMEAAASPIQKMSYESTTKFMKDAILQGQRDNGGSPSSRLVMGAQMAGGTGAFQLRYPLARLTKHPLPVIPESDVRLK